MWEKFLRYKRFNDEKEIQTFLAEEALTPELVYKVETTSPHNGTRATVVSIWYWDMEEVPEEEEQ